MLLCQMFQAGTNRPLPHHAPLDRAAPQLSQLQIKGDHVGVQSRTRVHSLVTDGAVTRPTMTRHPVRSLPGVTTEALYDRRPTTQSSENIFRPAPAQCCNVRQRNVRRPLSRRNSQILDNNVVETIYSQLGVRQHQTEFAGSGSRQHLSDRTIFVESPESFTSGEMDKSKSITPSKYMFIWRVPLASFDRRICWACSRYAPIAEPCPRPVIITNTALCQVKALQSTNV